MVFKILKAGRKIHALKRALESEKELKKYLAEMEEKRDRHTLLEDIAILNKEVEWLRFSQQACTHFESLTAPDKPNEEEPKLPEKLTASPFASIGDILLDPEKWSDKNVIIEGEVEFYNRSKKGDRFHIFSDNTGTVTGVCENEIKNGFGTLFGIARQTQIGKQIFLEIKNFHPHL